MEKQDRIPALAGVRGVSITLAIAVILSGCGGSSGTPDTASAALNTPAPPPAASQPVQPPPGPSAPSVAPKVDCTMESGSFQMTATGFTSDIVGMALYKYYPCEKLAHIFLPALSGLSNAATFAASPLPDFLIPQTIAAQEHLLGGFDNDKEQAPISVEIFTGDSTLHFLRDGSQEGWTRSGRKGVGLQVITVILD
ncbi:MAG: hypothetical protein JWM63_2537 [Gammaproteobacteria bacterium]|jgi:hypothetical protein|nr:hypothetical protein [Gammaproteobacteria bacterium]